MILSHLVHILTKYFRVVVFIIILSKWEDHSPSVRARCTPSLVSLNRTFGVCTAGTIGGLSFSRYSPSIRFQALDKDGNGQLDPSELLGKVS